MIESAPFPWIRRARATTPWESSARSGVSKKKTWRIWAWSGSSASAATVERWCGSGTVSFSSTLSAPFEGAEQLNELLVREARRVVPWARWWQTSLPPLCAVRVATDLLWGIVTRG